MKIDTTLYTGRPSDPAGRESVELACYDLLDSLQIPYQRVDHETAATIEACEEIEQYLGAEICKNLFLCNRQKTQFHLLLMAGNKPFRTKDFSKQIGSSRLSFAGPEDMERLLGVAPGSVTVLALMNDTAREVSLAIDSSVLNNPVLGCHPCRNTSTLRMSLSDVLEKFLPHLGISYTPVDLPVPEE